jgi:hypothetical protein
MFKNMKTIIKKNDKIHYKNKKQHCLYYRVSQEDLFHSKKEYCSFEDKCHDYYKKCNVSPLTQAFNDCIYSVATGETLN